MSKDCRGKVLNGVYGPGRTSFTFVTRNDTVVTFSGADTPAKGSQAAVALDRVIFFDGTDGTRNAALATGACTHTNPYAGPSHINCSASTKDGPFSASFVSDGKPPEIERL